MVIKGVIKKGEYFDSVSLMIVARQLTEISGVEDAAVVMGTQENKLILDSSELLIDEFKSTNDTDLLIVVEASDEKIVDEAISKVDELLINIRSKSDDASDYTPKSLEGALKILPDANLSLISVAGKFAAYEAMKALENGLHVMLFSDNVSIDQELKLKNLATENGLLVMGPDCGTAIINGVPLAFANVVKRGNVGIVAAAGTGLQEVSCIISNMGVGISQALGTGGRDVKKEIGGIMFIESLRALKDDSETEIIVLVSKPPHEDVLKKIAKEIKTIEKPIVAIFLGSETSIIKEVGAIPATNLEEAAFKAVSLATGKNLDEYDVKSETKKKKILDLASKECMNKGKGQKYLRGLFSGGTLCTETQILFKSVGDVYGNAPLRKELKLENSLKSYQHTVVDLGGDEFTVGRPHPMIDFSLRNKRILEEAKDSDVAVILLDVVLGYGSHMEPGKELSPVIKLSKQIAKEEGRDLSIVCSITGTDEDPQGRTKVKNELENAGAIVMGTNAEASLLTKYIIEKIGGRQ